MPRRRQLGRSSEMKNYPEGNDFWWTVGEMLAILVGYFAIQLAISWDGIAWMIGGGK